MNDQIRMITRLALEGHDSELFSFLDAEYVETLRAHPSANFPLYTFAHTIDGALGSVSGWNTDRFPLLEGLAFTEPAPVVKSGHHFYFHGYCSAYPLVCVSALALVQQLFNDGMMCKLDGNPWAATVLDYRLERLAFIRSQHRVHQARWQDLKAKYFRWCMSMLSGVPVVSHKERSA